MLLGQLLMVSEVGKPNFEFGFVKLDVKEEQRSSTNVLFSFLSNKTTSAANSRHSSH